MPDDGQPLPTRCIRLNEFAMASIRKGVSIEDSSQVLSSSQSDTTMNDMMRRITVTHTPTTSTPVAKRPAAQLALMEVSAETPPDLRFYGS